MDLYEILLLLFLLGLCCPLHPDTNLASVHPLDTELGISPEGLHIFCDLHQLDRRLLTFDGHVCTLDLGRGCELLLGRITSLAVERW